MERSPALVVAERELPSVHDELQNGLSPAELSERLHASAIFVMRFDETVDDLRERCNYVDGYRTYGYDRIPPENIVAVLVPARIHEGLMEAGDLPLRHPGKFVPVGESIDVSDFMYLEVEPRKADMPDWTGTLAGVLETLQRNLPGTGEISVAVHAMRLDTVQDMRRAGRGG